MSKKWIEVASVDVVDDRIVVRRYQGGNLSLTAAQPSTRCTDFIWFFSHFFFSGYLTGNFSPIGFFSRLFCTDLWSYWLQQFSPISLLRPIIFLPIIIFFLIDYMWFAFSYWCFTDEFSPVWFRLYICFRWWVCTGCAERARRTRNRAFSLLKALCS